MLRPIGTVILLIATCAPEPGTQTGIRPADLVLLDGRVVTVDDRFRMSTALAVRDGRFVAVGSNEDVRAHIGSTTRVIEGRGRTVIPGLIDTHVHALDVAAAEATQPFRNLRSIGELQDWIRSEAQRRPHGRLDLDAPGVPDATARTTFSNARGTGPGRAASPGGRRLRVRVLAQQRRASSSRHHARLARPAGRSHREECRRRTDRPLAERRRPVGPLSLGVGPGPH